MGESTDLEISLHRHDAEHYAVDFRFTQPGSDADIRLGQARPILARFDLTTLRQLILDPKAYGKALSQSLFSDPLLLSAFGQAVVSSQTLDAALRFRLLVGPSAPELHSLRWETLTDPRDDSPLCSGENILFSRYLSSLDWRPVRLRPQSELSALIVVANPSNLSDYSLAEVDVVGELDRARMALDKYALTCLPDASAGCRAGLNDMIDKLRQGSHDIVYLVCHGAIIREEAWLWLEDEYGAVARVPGQELIDRLKELKNPPRLLVLASCESAGSGAGDALLGLGPRLAEAGIPAVLAMQGKISMDTVSRMMPVFFRELQREGQIDQALSAARSSIRGQADFWMPALFMRLKSGRIWYVPGFGGDKTSFEKWPALLRSIKGGQCTPILGHGLVEPLIGSLRDIAVRWAETYRFPMAPHERESLPQVAQYLTINQDSSFPYDELEEYLRREIQTRFQADLPPELLSNSASLEALIEAGNQKITKDNPSNPYQALARLPLPIYITANMNNLLELALKTEGKDPQVVLCPWNEYVEQVENVFDREPDYAPTPSRPLIYHLFGRLNERDSLVLTEDNFFDFLIGVTNNKDLIPKAVRRALADSALLILGFQLHEWNFRVVFRSILAQQGGGRRNRYAHIAAQIDPEEGRILEPVRARRYLENYFSQGADINIYWGSIEDFMNELGQRYEESQR
jgi:hypothetical protein